MAESTDPFTELDDAIWLGLESHAGFQDQIKLSNRLKHNDKDIIRNIDAEIELDLPAVEVRPARSRLALFSTSDSSLGIRAYAFIWRTGDRRLQRGANRLEWNLYRAIATMTLGTLLQINFVTHVTVEDSVEDPDGNEETLRGNQGWSGELDLIVHLCLSNQLLLSDD